MFIGVYELNGFISAKLYNGFEEWNKDIFPPETNIIDLLELNLSLKEYTALTIHPRRKISDYKRKQMLLRDKAMEWQHIMANNSFSWLEYSTVCAWFEDKAKKYGLLKEFQENCIC